MTNDFKAFAVGAGANVLTQPAYTALAALITNGFQSGTANSEQLNKVWRQSSVMASVVGDLIVKRTGQDALDNGDTATLLSNFQTAIAYATIATAVGGTANAIQATFPFVPQVADLVNGMTFQFKATASSTSSAPTFTPNNGVIPAKAIVKGNNSSLATNDILTGMWVSLTYDSSLDKWVIYNPATGLSLTSSNTGVIFQWSGTTAPSGSLACPLVPTNVSRTTYAALHAVYAAQGYPWGSGDGSTTFGIPYFPADYTTGQANGNVGSSTVGQILAHTHVASTSNARYGSGGTNPGTNFWASGGDVGYGGTFSLTTTSTGGTANLAAAMRTLFCVWL